MSNNDSGDIGCGCFAALFALAMLFVGIGLIGLAWRFMMWAWTN